MLLEDFKRHIEVLPEEVSNALRALYIEHFIDANKEGYNKCIAQRELFSDGYCYTGYLWDYLLEYNKITFRTLIEELLNKKMLLVLWDIHSCEKIFIENYWKFQKDRILKVDARWIKEGIEHLPEDIYIFDYNFSWTYILTHEDDGKRRICLYIR